MERRFRRNGILFIVLIVCIAALCSALCVVTFSAWDGGGTSSEVVCTGKVGLFYVDCPDDPEAAVPSETKVVRTLYVKDDEYHNYICVSRVGANVATRAYISFEVVYEGDIGSTPVSDMTAERAETDADGVPIGGKNGIDISCAPSSVDGFSSAYIELDFNTGVDMYYAIDFVFKTTARFTLVARVDDKGPETTEEGYYAVPSDLAEDKYYVGYRMLENKYERIYELPYAYRVANRFRNATCRIAHKGGSDPEIPTVDHSDLVKRDGIEYLYFDAYSNKMASELPKYRIVVDFGGLTPSTDADYAPALSFRTTLFDDTDTYPMSAVNAKAGDATKLFFADMSETAEKNIGSFTVRASTKSGEAYTRANSFDINLISLKSNKFFDFIYNEERKFNVNSLKRGSYHVTATEVPLKDVGAKHSNWVGEIFKFEDPAGVQTFGVGEGENAHGFAVVYRTGENEMRNDPTTYKAIPLTACASGDDWDYSIELDTTLSGANSDLLGRDFMIYYNGNAMTEELDESVVRIKKVRSHLYHIAYRIGPPKTQYGNEDSINKARGLYYIKIRKGFYNSATHRYDDNVNIMYNGETSGLVEIPDGAAWSENYKEGYYAVGQFSQWAVNAAMRLTPRMTGFGNYALKKDYIISSRTDYVYDYSYSEASGDGKKVGTDDVSKPDAYKIVRVTKSNADTVHYDWYGMINGRVTQNLGIDINDNITVNSERIFFNVYDHNIVSAQADEVVGGSVVSSNNGYYAVGRFSDWKPNPFFKLTNRSITAFDILNNDFAPLDYYNGFKIVEVTENGGNIAWYPNNGGNLVESSSTVGIDGGGNVYPRRNSCRAILDARGWGYNSGYSFHIHAWKKNAQGGDEPVTGEWKDRKLMTASDTPGVYYYELPQNTVVAGVIITKDEIDGETIDEKDRVQLDNSHNENGIVFNAVKNDKVDITVKGDYTVSAAVNGNAVDIVGNSFAVNYGDRVTVSANADVSGGKEYGFIVDGNLIETTAGENTVSATFTATGSHEVECKRVYEVKGTTSAFAAVTVAEEKGGGARKVAVADADDQGGFTVKLPDGVYYASAETEVQISGTVKFEVAGSNMTISGHIEPDKFKIGENVYEEMSFDYIKGYYSSGTGANYGGYFAHLAAGSEFVISSEVKPFSGLWYSSGFIVETGDTFVRFYFRYNDSNEYDCVSWSNEASITQKKEEFVAPFASGTARLALIYRSGTYIFLLNGKIVHMATDYAAPTGRIGLVNEHSVEIVDWNYSTDLSGTDIDVIRTVKVLSDGVELSVNGKPLQISGGVSTVTVGDTVDVSIDVPIDEEYAVLVDGVIIDSVCADGKLTASFDVRDDHTVSYEKAYAVNGKAEAGAVVTIAMSTGESVKKLTANADGEFTVYLPIGAYYAVVENAALISEPVAFTVAESGNSVTAYDPSKIKIEFGNEFGQVIPLALPYEYTSGRYVSGNEPNYGGYFAGIRTDGEFTITAVVDRFNGAWASAGFTVGTVNGFVRFYLRYNPDGRMYDSVSWNEQHVPNVVQNKDALYKPFENENAVISLIYRNGAYIFTVNGVVAYAVDGYGAPSGRVGLACERAVTYISWGYSDTVVTDNLGKTVVSDKADITMSVNGNAFVSGGRALAGDRITATKQLADGENIVITVDGKDIPTVNDGGSAMGEFTVDGDHTVDYYNVYAVGGITSPDATVRITNINGDIIKQFSASENGSFEVLLPNGDYYVYCVTDTHISRSAHAAVNGAAVYVGDVIPDKIRLDESAIAGCTSVIFDVRTGKYVGTSTHNGSLYKEVLLSSASSYVLTAEVEKFTDDWFSAGVVIDNGGAQYRIVLRRNGGKYYDIVAWYPDGREADQIRLPSDLAADPFGGNGIAEFAVAYNNGAWYVLVNGVLVHTVKDINAALTVAESEKDAAAAPVRNNVAVGLFCEQNVAYADWGYSNERSEVAKYIGRTLTVTDMTVYVDGDVLTGSVKTALLGDVVTVFDTEITHKIYLDGKELDCVAGEDSVSASFTVTGNHAVTSYVAYAVSGTTDPAATVYVNNGKTELNVTPSADGKFSVLLTAGTYYLRAQTDTTVSAVKEVTVSSQNIENIALDGFKPIVDANEIAGWSSLKFDDKSGYCVSGENYFNSGFFKGITVSESGTFTVTATVSSISETDWASVGFIVGTKDKYMRFVFRRNGDSKKFDCVLFKTVGAEAFGAGDLENCSFDEPLELKLVYADGQYSFCAGGKEMFATEEKSGAGDLSVGLFCERAVTYTDWKVSKP